jgi:hypothetical protein
MRTMTPRRWALGLCALGMTGLWGCATNPAVVFVSPNYNTRHIQTVTVLGFSDAPNQAGSGAMVADIYEKYLFNLRYTIVDPNQAQQVLQMQKANPAAGLDAPTLAALRTLNLDAYITGSVSELTETSEQTVMVDVPQEETEPVYQQVVVQGRHGDDRVRTVQTGNQTTFIDQSVPETEMLPARAGITARMVDIKNGELLWSGSGSADGMNIPSAVEATVAKVMDALQQELSKKSAPTH